MAHEKNIMHLDMNSFFASVEQQANPLLRGKPIAVSGKEGSRSVIVASSREAKKFGVKTGMLGHDARKLCPEITFVEPDGDKYEHISRKFLEILKKFTDKMEVFSIDEAFLDLTGFAKDFEQAKIIGLRIKSLFKAELGDWLTCSIGISNNKLLAKLASDLQKPDGLVIIDENNKFDILDKIKLTDLCGIGARIETRLNAIGVKTIPEMRACTEEKLTKFFGSFYGRKLYLMARGEDYDEVGSYLNVEEIKSVGRSYTLPENTSDKQAILVVLMHLCERMCRELRRKKLQAKTFVFYLRYDNFKHTGGRQTITIRTNDTLEIFNLGKELIQKLRLSRPVRLVGVWSWNLATALNQQSLWLKERKQKQLIPFLDKINDMYGELTVKPALLLKLERLRRKVGGFRLRD